MEGPYTLLCVLCSEIIMCQVCGDHPHHRIHGVWIFLDKIAQQSTAVLAQCYIGLLDEIIDDQCRRGGGLSQGAQDYKSNGTLIPANELEPSLSVLFSTQPS